MNKKCKKESCDNSFSPLVIDIDQAAKSNPYYRVELWTGKYMQLTVMSIPVCGDIGLEMHPELDQFIRIEYGCALVQMGSSSDSLNYSQRVNDNFAIIIPAGTWHNIINTGNRPLKLYSLYAPPKHPIGTVHETKQEAEEAEKNY